MQIRSDTIAAISTAPGRGALAVVRVSGNDAHHIVQPLCARWPSEPRTCLRTTLRDASDLREVDTVLVTRFDAPASYTGEAMAEISCHGGTVVSHEVLALLISRGVRQAEPGEFTQRAVLNGKLDLLQAEAIGDLIDAATSAQRRVATAHLHGGLTRRIAALREIFLDLEALLAYDVDFPEEDDGPIARERIDAAAVTALEAIGTLQATAPLAEVIRSGAVVVIAGAPNAGKSSLFNALLGSERAIVTEIPGTTRDALEAVVERVPWPIRLVDTAGLRDTADRLERLGIEMSERHLKSAHLVLACATTAQEMMQTREGVSALTASPILSVYTKHDLQPDLTVPADSVAVSAEDGSGLTALLTAIEGILGETLGSLPVDGAVLTRERHRIALDRAASELRAFQSAWKEQRLPATIAAVHIRSAVAALDELIGSIDVEHVLARVFQSFCVGK